MCWIWMLILVIGIIATVNINHEEWSKLRLDYVFSYFRPSKLRQLLLFAG